MQSPKRSASRAGQPVLVEARDPEAEDAADDADQEALDGLVRGDLRRELALTEHPAAEVGERVGEEGGDEDVDQERASVQGKLAQQDRVGERQPDPDDGEDRDRHRPGDVRERRPEEGEDEHHREQSRPARAGSGTNRRRTPRRSSRSWPGRPRPRTGCERAVIRNSSICAPRPARPSRRRRRRPRRPRSTTAKTHPGDRPEDPCQGLRPRRPGRPRDPRPASPAAPIRPAASRRRGVPRLAGRRGQSLVPACSPVSADARPRCLIRLRSRHPALARGAATRNLVEAGSPSPRAYPRRPG